MKAALFLDRDGVIIEEVGYLSQIDQVRLISGAADAIGRVNAAGYPVIVVTNQAGVARGYFSERRVMEIHRFLDDLMARYHAHIDAYYFCPHHPSEGKPPYLTSCTCRKPQPGLLLQAVSDMNLSLADSFMVGDKESDILAGIHAGCHTILVRTGYGRVFEGKLQGMDVYRDMNIVDGLTEAVDIFLTDVESAPSA